MLIRYLNDVDDTNRLAEDVAGVMQKDDLVLLTGGIGSGKTTFVQALARSLGVTETVTSPSFVIHAVYDSGRIPLNHVDLYRLDEAAEVADLGLDDVIDGTVTVVEWADRYRGFAEPYLHVTLDLGARDEERIATVEANGNSWTKRLSALEADSWA